MNDVYLTFQGTGREGSIATGTYLLDAAKQLGVDLDCDCNAPEPGNACAVQIIKGVALLSKTTTAEIEQLSASERKAHRRLACQTKIQRPGEIEVMVVKKAPDSGKSKKADPKDESREYKKEFEQLPLDQKISSLVELEAIALGETLSYIVNSPYEAFGKMMGVLAGFGRDLEEKDREAKVPKEHRENHDESASGSAGAKETAADRKSKAKSGGPAGRPRKRTSGAKRGRPVKKKEEDGGRGQ